MSLMHDLHFQVMNPFVYALQDQVFQNFIQRKLKHIYGLLSVSSVSRSPALDI